MGNLQLSIQQNKAATFDWLVFAISFSLGFVFPSLRELIISPLFSYLMLAALVLYILGSWLKHFPLYYRLITTGDENKRVPYTLFLIVGHFVLMIIVIIFSMRAAENIIGIKPGTRKEASGGWIVFISMIGAFIFTWLVFRNKSKLKTRKVFSPAMLFRRELAGDICLVTAVSMFSFVFWEKGVIAMLSSRHNTSLSDIWFLFVFLALGYMLCYLPLRYLFLVEDHFSNKTWKRMLLIFGLLLLKALFEMLNV